MIIKKRFDRVKYEKIKTAQIKCDQKTENGKSRTMQEFAEECDINNIISKYRKTGILGTELTHNNPPMYGDYENIDYTDTCRKIAKVQQDFMMLSGPERAEHDNDPQKWLLNLQEKEAKAIADKVAEDALLLKQKADTEAGRAINNPPKKETIPPVVETTTTPQNRSDEEKKTWK